MTGFEKLNKIFDGLNETADKMLYETAESSRAVETNGGKAPDVNEILEQVFTENQESETESYPMRVNKKDRETIQKHWSHSVVFTDGWCVDTD